MSKIETQQETKTYERMEKIVVTIKKILVRTDKNNEFVTQIRFGLDDDTDLTYKPKKRVSKEGKERGLNIVSEYSESIKLSELPEKLFSLNDLLNENGKVRLLCDYIQWNTKDNEGKDVLYSFMNETDFVSCYPIDKDNKEIKI